MESTRYKPSNHVLRLAARLEKGDHCMVFAEMGRGDHTSEEVAEAINVQDLKHPIRALIRETFFSTYDEE